MIELKNIVFDTPEERRILNDFSLSLKSGSWNMLTGPSGVGKTTVLFLMGLLQKPQEGAYYFQGEEILQRRELLYWRRPSGPNIDYAEIGIMFSRFHDFLKIWTFCIMWPAPAWLLTRDRKAAMEAAPGAL